tara:strand:- start:485 stop:712 length:228 start_codon:yes stop_codon:yes gene_type:complete
VLNNSAPLNNEEEKTMSKNFTDPWANYPILKHKDRIVIQNENYSDLYEINIIDFKLLDKSEDKNRITQIVKVKGK